MSSTFGKYFRVTTFGESHGKAVGCVIDGVKPGIKIDEALVQKELDKRKPGQSKVTTQRKEPDKFEILSGVFEGKTTGHPICIVIWNKDANSKHYENIKDLFRPGHADFTFFKKYGIRDYRGGGRQSARETAARVAAGAIAKQQLEKSGIKIKAYVKQVGNIKVKSIDLDEVEKNIVRAPNSKDAKKIEELIMKVRGKGDSIGGIVEVVAYGIPAGLGDPVADKLNAKLASALMSIPAVKGIEIGEGFNVVNLKGSQDNDVFIKKGKKIICKSNHAGGILGGISTGMPIVARAAFKPASSIYKEQETVDVNGKKVNFRIQGRHDPAIFVRGVAVVEAMVALVLYDALLANEAMKK
ncbi:TPA: chorismate synthase [Candidatus Woesearchaeota archaeon]|nr:chorismate synthase [Candidatus Woesearchaeota archaeon]